MDTSDTTPKIVKIPLTKGFIALVDECDADLIVFKWQANKYGYASRRDYTQKPNRRIHMHRLILERVLNRPLLPSEEVDHIHGNTCDNRRSELRLASRFQNNQNTKFRKNNTSGFKGVHKSHNRWRACITANGKNIHLGYFDTPEEASNRYCEASKELHGEFSTQFRMEIE